MKKMHISDADAVKLILQDETWRSNQARYDHRLHAMLMATQRMSCRAESLLDDSPSTLAYWVNRFEAEGLSGPADTSRPVKPRRLDEKLLQQIQEALSSSPSECGLAQICKLV